MTRRRLANSLVLLTVLISSFGLTSTAFSQSPEGDIAAELSDLNQTVAQLVQLVARLVEQNQDDLLLRRLEIKIRQATPLESELQQKSDQLLEYDVYLQQQEKDLEESRRKLFEAESGVSALEGVTPEQLATQLREQIGYQERSLVEAENQMHRMQNRIAELEGLLSPLRVQLATLEQALDDRQPQR